MALKSQTVDARTGEVTIAELDPADFLTEAQAKAADLAAAREAEKAAIRAELAANDLKVIRAILDGDHARIAEHETKQAALRARLQ